jgi:nickel-type superoxide dismutase
MLLIPFLNIQSIAIAHCQVPCGIYDDALRIVQIKEDFKTIRKAMDKITQLSEKSGPLSNNQLNRWVMTKEQHASNIQKTVSEYFLIQRVKADKSKKYIDLTTTLHKILVATMKCKQTVDNSNVDNGIKLIEQFINHYFDSHELEHLKKLSE